MRIWFTIFILGFTLFSFFDCARTEQEQVRRMPKWAWLLIILFFEFIGALAWQFAGKPKRNPGSGGNRRGGGKILPPDDDPDFLRKI
ncbi:MAG: PLD nuclease N-terminal domain-containing protein [Actinobacteria bacterium]|nr:PLD nuclease N-terminal domain-containing protein [Actinomycetota bacterium]